MTKLLQAMKEHGLPKTRKLLKVTHMCVRGAKSSEMFNMNNGFKNGDNLFPLFFIISL